MSKISAYVELHCHSNYSFQEGASSLYELLAQAKDLGYPSLAITDHNTIEGALLFKSIASFKVIVGEEINTTQGEVTGLFLKERIPPGLKALETVNNIKSQGGLVSIPHPFDIFRSSVIKLDALHEILPYVDIIEGFNARNTLPSSDSKAYELAKENNLLCSGVSDAHTAYELGRGYVEMPLFDGTPAGFLDSLSRGNIIGRRTTPLIHVLTSITKLKRKFRKQLGF